MLSIIQIALGLTLCVLLPGVLLLRRIQPRAGPVEQLAAGGALGLLLVSYLVFVPAYFLGIYLTGPLVAGVSLVLVLLLRRELAPALRDRFGLRRAERGHAVVLLFSALVGLIYFVKYDPTGLVMDARYYLDGQTAATCHHVLLFSMFEALNPGVASMSLGEANAGLPAPTNGNVAIYGSFMGLLGWPGYRVVAALVPALVAALAWVIADRLFGRLALLSSALLALNPQMLSQIGCDRSSIALLLSLLLIYCTAVRPTPSPLVGGVLGLGASTGLRYLPATYLLGLGLWMASGKNRLRNLLGLVCVFVVTSIPWAHQLFVTGHTGPDPYVEHSLGPLVFHLPRFMNLPFLTDGLVRPPLVPMPSPLLYLFGSVRTWGLLLLAVMLVGTWQLWRTRRRLLGLLLGMAAPGMLIVSLQGYVIEEDHMFLSLTWSGVLFVLLAAGFHALASGANPRARVAGATAVVLLVGLLGLGAKQLGEVTFPVDPRRMEELHLRGYEDPYLREDPRNKRLLPNTDPLLEAVGFVAQLPPGSFWDLRVRGISLEAARSWSSPWVVDPPGSLGPPAPLRLALSGPLVGEDWYTVDGSGAERGLGLPDEGWGYFVDLPGGREQDASIRVLVHRSGPGQVNIHKQSFAYDPDKAAHLAEGVFPSPSQVLPRLSFDIYGHLYGHRDISPVVHGFPHPDKLIAHPAVGEGTGGIGGPEASVVLAIPAGTRVLVMEHIFAGPDGQAWLTLDPSWLEVGSDAVLRLEDD